MGMPCAHTIQPTLCNGDSLEPEQFKSQWYLEHGDLEPVDYRLLVQNPETIRPRGRPGSRQQITGVGVERGRGRGRGRGRRRSRGRPRGRGLSHPVEVQAVEGGTFMVFDVNM
ncbi:hypothetical protein V1523DRAFT_404709 [Lipomyces doorenjongii]